MPTCPRAEASPNFAGTGLICTECLHVVQFIKPQPSEQHPERISLMPMPECPHIQPAFHFGITHFAPTNTGARCNVVANGVTEFTPPHPFLLQDNNRHI